LSNRAASVGVRLAPRPQDYGYTTKADIYSFGITALELINGVTPYHEWQSLQILLDKLDRPYPPLAGCKRGLSRSFYRMVAACLRKDPAQRCVARPRHGRARFPPRAHVAARGGPMKSSPAAGRPTAKELLNHRFIRKARDRNYIVVGLTDRTIAMREAREQGARPGPACPRTAGRGAHASQRRPLGDGCRAAALAAAQQSGVQLDANGMPIGMNGGAAAAAPPPEGVYAGPPEAVHEAAALDAGELGMVSGADDMAEPGAGRRGPMFFIASPAGSPVADGLQVSADAAYPQPVPEWTL